MTLTEAIAHIQRKATCGLVEAQVELKTEIARGTIPAKWSLTEGSNDAVDLEYLGRSQLVLYGPGLALDSETERCRPLSVLRPAVLATWPQARSNAATASERTPGLTNRAQRETAEDYTRWMSLVEAVEHIRMLCRCDSVDALGQLKEEIGDGMVPVKWAGSKAVSGNADTDWSGAKPPNVRYLKTLPFLLVGVGFAPEKDEDTYQLRPLLIERSAVQKLWPFEDHEILCQNRGGGKDRPLKRPSYTDDEIRAAVEEVYKAAGKNPPNINVAEPLVREKLPGAGRKAIRQILKEEEFVTLRRKPGNQPKR